MIEIWTGTSQGCMDFTNPAVEMPGFFTRCVCGGSERQPVKVNQPTTTS